jgi:hypothetical protein
VDVRVIAFALGVHGAVDAALGADRMAPFDGNDREHVDVFARFRELDDRHQSREAAADDDVALRHFCAPPENRARHSARWRALQRRHRHA